MITRFEDTCQTLIADSSFWRTILLGGLLSFIPIVFFFPFGYLYRLGEQVRRSGKLVLPAWDEWERLFTDGIKFAVVVVLFFGVPLLLAALVGALLNLISDGYLAPASYLCLSVAVLAGPFLTAWGLRSWQRGSDWANLVDLRKLGADVGEFFPQIWIPSLIFGALMALGLPLFGFAFFAGFLMLIPYFMMVLREKPRSSKSSEAEQPAS